MLMLVSPMGEGTWTKEIVDTYIENDYRIGNMKRLGFKGISFYHFAASAPGKKAKLVCYGAFTFKK